jgi:DNA polymerase-4
MSFSPCILHLDMDAFFASVEQADDPSLRGLPLIVGGGDRGVVSACSYEARAFGVHSAMPMVQARRLCPQAVIKRGSMSRYAEVSRQIMRVLENFSPVVEQASVDEAYLDVAGLERLYGPIEVLAARIKAAVKEATGLNCSVGVAPIKFLAKVASDYRKPDGLFILRPEDVPAFLAELPVEKIPGVGAKALPRLKELGVRTAADVLRYSEAFWVSRLGKWGACLRERAGGVDPRPVAPWSEAKSEGAENTFERDTRDPDELKRWLMDQAERVSRRLRAAKVKGRTVTLKLKYEDFKQITRSRTLSEQTSATETVFRTAAELLDEEPLRSKVRLIGISVSNFDRRPIQLSLFPDPDKERRERLDETLDAIREKFGREKLVRGRLFDFKK